MRDKDQTKRRTKYASEKGQMRGIEFMKEFESKNS